MYTGTKFSTAVPSSNGANYDPRGSGIGTSTWSEPGSAAMGELSVGP